MGPDGVPDVSVVVCTFNRAEALEEALESLACQSVERMKYEILVVDNGSTDDTQERIEAFRKKHPDLTVVSVYEPVHGLAYARNRGFKEARGRYVAYIDDDARAHRDWVGCAIDLFRRVRPTPMCVGGKVLPIYQNPRPPWFKDDYETRTFGPVSRFLSKGEDFSGSNMIWRKEVLEEFGGFDVRLGVRGDYLLLGEETALFEKLWESTERACFYYSPELVVYHVVPAWKMKVSYQWKRAFSWGKSWALVHGPDSSWDKAKFLAHTFSLMMKRTAVAFKEIRKYSFYQNWLVEMFKPVIGDAGRVAGCVGLNIPIKQR